MDVRLVCVCGVSVWYVCFLILDSNLVVQSPLEIKIEGAKPCKFFFSVIFKIFGMR